jgi:hypothetical protein
MKDDEIDNHRQALRDVGELVALARITDPTAVQRRRVAELHVRIGGYADAFEAAHGQQVSGG